MSDRAGTWTPLLGGDLRARAVAAARGIAEEMARRADALVACGGDLCESSLMAGTAGIAVFLHHAGAALRDPDLTALAEDTLAHALDHAHADMEAGRGAPTFGYGLAGVAWALAHITATAGADDDAGGAGSNPAGSGADRNDSDGDGDADDDGGFASSLLALVSDREIALPHTLFIGLVGYGVSAREMPGEDAHRCEREIVARLRESCTTTDGAMTWHSAGEILPRLPDGGMQRGRFNLGMPHGVAGVLSFLSRCAHSPADLVRGAARWLLAQRLPPGGVSWFPPWIIDGDPPVPLEPAETAWCYGDPCVGAALHAAGVALADRELEATAIDILERAAIRSPEHGRVSEPLFCHGAAGLAHLFNRAWQWSGSEILRNGATRWFERLLAMQKRDAGFAGFSSSVWRGDRAELTGHPGLLEGASGIGLALLAGACEPEPSWDRALLLS